jgi:protein O-mannosyl-transferase
MMAKQKKHTTQKPVSTVKNKTAVKKKDHRIFIYAILIAVLTFLVFSNSLRNDFVKNFDDILYFSSADNAKALNANDIADIFTTNVAGIYHPLTILSLAVERNLFGPNAMHFHFFNLLIHVINVLLVFWFIYLLTKKIEISVIVALFFGIHPMHVESVAWISERKDVLYTLFFLASLITYLKYLKDETKYKYLIYSIILFLLSLLSKSAAVCLAPLIVLIDYYQKRKFNSKVVLEKIPFFLLALLFGIISLMSQKSAGAMGSINNLHPDYSFIDRILMFCYSIMFYIGKAILPLNLSAIHYYPDKSSGALPILYYLAPIGIALIIFLIAKLNKFRKDLVFGFLFYLITIFLVLQFIPVGYALVSERYSYVPYIGLLFILGKFFCDFADNKFSNYSKPRKNYIVLIIAFFAVMFLYLTYERNNVWKNDVTLFSDVIEKNTEAGHAYWARGNGKYDKKDYNGALSDFNEAITNHYRFADVYNSRGKCYYEMDSIEAALSDYSMALKTDSSLALAYYNRGHTKQVLQDYLGSIIDFKKAIENDVQNPGLVYNEMSYSQYQIKDFQNALASTNKAIELDPEYAQTYLTNKTKIEKAIEENLHPADTNKVGK